MTDERVCLESQVFPNHSDCYPARRVPAGRWRRLHIPIHQQGHGGHRAETPLMDKRNPWTQPDEPSAWRKLLRAMRGREGRTSMCRNSMLAFQLVPLLPIYHLVSRQTSGRAKWTHQAKQAEVEIKVERRPDVLYLILNLSLNLSLLPAGGLFQQPASQVAQSSGRRRRYRHRFSHS